MMTQISPATSARPPVRPPVGLPARSLVRLCRAGAERACTTLAALVLAACPLRAEDAPAPRRLPGIVAPGGVALSGYDAVAYFSEGAAQPGEAGHALKWKGVMWYFTSAENLGAFEMNPAAFLPRFGGHCVVTLAEGRLAPGDPRVFVMIDGRLYLARDREALARWENDPAGLVARAEATWAAIRKP